MMSLFPDMVINARTIIFILIIGAALMVFSPGLFKMIFLLGLIIAVFWLISKIFGIRK